MYQLLTALVPRGLFGPSLPTFPSGLQRSPGCCHRYPPATCDQVLSAVQSAALRWQEHESLQGQLLMVAGLGEHVSIWVHKRNDMSQGHGRGLSSGPCPVYGLAACRLARFWETFEAFSVFFPSPALLCVITRITHVFSAPWPLSVLTVCVRRMTL